MLLKKALCFVFSVEIAKICKKFAKAMVLLQKLIICTYI